jgi:hypothetical protein
MKKYLIMTTILICHISVHAQKNKPAAEAAAKIDTGESILIAMRPFRDTTIRISITRVKFDSLGRYNIDISKEASAFLQNYRFQKTNADEKKVQKIAFNNSNKVTVSYNDGSSETGKINRTKFSSPGHHDPHADDVDVGFPKGGNHNELLAYATKVDNSLGATIQNLVSPDIYKEYQQAEKIKAPHVFARIEMKMALIETISEKK